MPDFDQDAVDEAVRILQPQIDELKAEAAASLQPVKYQITYADGRVDTFDLVSSVTP